MKNRAGPKCSPDKILRQSIISRAIDLRDNPKKLSIGSHAPKRECLEQTSWKVVVRELIEHLQYCARSSATEKINSRSSADPFFFLPLCLPVVGFGARRLDAIWSRSAARLFSAEARRKSRVFLATRLLCVITPAARKALDELAKSGDRAASSMNEGAASGRCWFYQPSPSARLLELFARFPALARLVAELCVDWGDSIYELSTRLKKDRKQLMRKFPGLAHSRNTARPFVRDAQFGLGDCHEHGRAVILLEFGNGRKIIYKPRDCRGEQEWGLLLHNLAPSSLRPRHPRILTRDGYGWIEFITSRPCRSVAQMRTFYRRAGVQLCAATLLRASDLHLDNVIAAGAHPVVIDAETLWQMQSAIPELIFHPARTGLIPVQDETGAAIPSAFGAAPSVSDSLPVMADLVEQIIEGFCEAASRLRRPAGIRRRVQRQLERIMTQAWRRMAWSTSNYELLREGGIRPEWLTNGAARFEWLLTHCSRPGTTAALVFEEAAALARFDIPCFRLRDDQASGGKILPSVATLLKLCVEIRQAFAARPSSFPPGLPASAGAGMLGTPKNT